MLSISDCSIDQKLLKTRPNCLEPCACKIINARQTLSKVERSVNPRRMPNITRLMPLSAEYSKGFRGENRLSRDCVMQLSHGGFPSEVHANEPMHIHPATPGFEIRGTRSRGAKRRAARCPARAFYEFSRRLDLKVPIYSHGSVVRAANEINGAKVFFWRLAKSLRPAGRPTRADTAALQMQMQGARGTRPNFLSFLPTLSPSLAGRRFVFDLTLPSMAKLFSSISMYEFTYELPIDSVKTEHCNIST